MQNQTPNKEPPGEKTLIIGRSARSLPIRAFLTGSGRSCLMFVGPFSGDPAALDFLSVFRKELQSRRESGRLFGRIDLSSLLRLRTLCFLPLPDPDAAESLPSGRQPDPSVNFNFLPSSAQREKSPGDPDRAPLPESAPAARALASFARSLPLRLALFFEKGEGILLPSSTANRAFCDYCLRISPLPVFEALMPGSPEEWLASERGVFALRFGVSFSEPLEKEFRKLIPFLSSLLAV